MNIATRHVHHSFVYISLPSLHDYDVKHFPVEEKPTYNAFLSNSKRVAESTYERYPSSTDIECIVTLFVLEIHCSWPRRIVGGCPEPCTASLLCLFLSWPRVELSSWNSSFNAPIKLILYNHVLWVTSHVRMDFSKFYWWGLLTFMSKFLCSNPEKSLILKRSVNQYFKRNAVFVNVIKSWWIENKEFQN